MLLLIESIYNDPKFKNRLYILCIGVMGIPHINEGPPVNESQETDLYDIET